VGVGFVFLSLIAVAVKCLSTTPKKQFYGYPALEWNEEQINVRLIDEAQLEILVEGQK